MTYSPTALFPLGRIMATPGALSALGDEGISAETLLNRHLRGDWGDLSEDDRRENDLSVRNALRIFSAYLLPKTRVKIWVIMEADRTATTVLLPEDY